MNVRSFTAASAALLALACGGSSKSNSTGQDIAYTGPTTSVAVATPAAAQATASAAFATVQTVAGAVSGVSMTVGAAGTAPSYSPAQLARLAARHLALAGAAQVSGVAFSDGGPCAVSGSAAIAGDIRDQSSALAWTGDWAQLTFSNCVDEAGGGAANGTMRLEVLAGNGVSFVSGGSPASLPAGYEYRVQLTVTDFSFVDAQGGWFGMDGGFTLAAVKQASPAELTESVSGTSFAVAAGRGSEIVFSSLLAAPAGRDRYATVSVAEYGNGFFAATTASRASVDGKVCGTALGGCVEVVTTTPFRALSGARNPSAGSMTITAGSASIALTAVDGVNVDVTYDLDVNAPPPATTVHATWSCLEARTCAF